MKSVPYQKCPRCDGQGSVLNIQFTNQTTGGMLPITNTCPACKGIGIIPEYVVPEFPIIHKPGIGKELVVIEFNKNWFGGEDLLPIFDKVKLIHKATKLTIELTDSQDKRILLKALLKIGFEII